MAVLGDLVYIYSVGAGLRAVGSGHGGSVLGRLSVENPSFDVGMASLVSLGEHLLVHSRDVRRRDTSRSTLIEIRWSRWKGASYRARLRHINTRA